MAARKRVGLAENTRERIKASMIVNRLTDHALGKLKKPMDATQVTAALGLLKKTLPDLVSTTLEGNLNNHHYVVGSDPLNEDEWQEKYQSDLEASSGPAESTDRLSGSGNTLRGGKRGREN